MEVTILKEARAERLGLALRVGFAAGFAVVAFLLGVRGAAILLPLLYAVAAGVHLLFEPKLEGERRTQARFAQIACDVGIITLAVHLTGSISTVAVMLYALLIFGVTMDWGMREGRFARITSNYTYLVLVAATWGGFFRYDPFIQDASHLDFIRTHNVVFSAVPSWLLFAAAGLSVGAINLATFVFAARLVRQREEAERRLVEVVSQRAVTDVVTGMTSSLKEPLGESEELLRSAQRELEAAHGIYSELGDITASAESDMDLARRYISQSRALLVRLEELVKTKSEMKDAVSLRDVIHEAKKDLVREHGARVFAIRESVDPDLPPVRGDLPLLYRSIRNVLENALFSLPPEGGIIQVSAFARAGRIIVECADTGSGFAAEELGQLLDPLHYAGLGVGRAGMGLALVREVIRHHRGEMSIETVPGQGTTIRLLLPRSA